MYKLGIIGFGRMGKILYELSKESGDFEPAKCFDTLNEEIDSLDGFDILIDFSHPSNLRKYAKMVKCPVVLATTGYTEEDLNIISELSKRVPVFRSSNMSLGVNILCNLARKLSEQVSDAEIEIVETHHNRKVDAPSGTALMLFDAINKNKDKKAIFGRGGEAKRQKGDVGIHALRYGNVPGEHEIIFSFGKEVIKISHSAESREIFATGALEAARFIMKKQNGIYDMNDILNS